MFNKNERKSYYPTNERKNTIKRESHFSLQTWEMKQPLFSYFLEVKNKYVFQK